MTTIIEWFKALQGIDWVLVGAIVLLFVGYLYILLWIIPTLEFVGGRVGRRKIQVFGILFGSLVVFYLFYNLHGILPNEWVEISLLAGLVAATSGLAVYAAAQAYTSVRMAEATREQANASVKMADGMARPAIDFKRDTAKADIARRESEAYAAIHEETPHGLSCILCNVGVGSAIDVRSFIQHPERGRLPWEFGTIESRGKTERWILSISHEDNRIALIASYKDVYGRAFESSREVKIDKEKGWQLGPLRISPLPEKEE